MQSMLHVDVGTTKSKWILPEITKAILAILASQAGDDVKKAAIDALSKTFNVHITNCNFTGK